MTALSQRDPEMGWLAARLEEAGYTVRHTRRSRTTAGLQVAVAETVAQPFVSIYQSGGIWALVMPNRWVLVSSPDRFKAAGLNELVAAIQRVLLDWRKSPFDLEGFRTLSLGEWVEWEAANDHRIWLRYGWESLVEEDAVWGEMNRRFCFPNHDFTMPFPHLRFDVNWAYAQTGDAIEAFAARLRQLLVTGFRMGCCRSGQVLALDWRHPCYRLDPLAWSLTADESCWAILPFPARDSLAFVCSDFAAGWLIHVSGVIGVFGETLVEGVGKHLAALCTR